MTKKHRKRKPPAKQRDPSWKLRHELGHKVEIGPKAPIKLTLDFATIEYLKAD